MTALVPEYPFLGANAQNGYRVFPAALENDKNVFFHGTAETTLTSILSNGFIIPSLRNPASLPSISFATESSLPLRYACEARNAASSPNGCIIAARFDDLTKPGIKVESFGIHVYKFDKQPQIVGYCIIPAAYLFE